MENILRGYLHNVPCKISRRSNTMLKRYYWETENSHLGGMFKAESDQQAKEMMLKIMESRPNDELLCLYYEGEDLMDMVELFYVGEGWKI
jgi:hypothetical protein